MKRPYEVDVLESGHRVAIALMHSELRRKLRSSEPLVLWFKRMES